MATVRPVSLVVLSLILLALVQSSLQGIYSAALYRYVETGEACIGFGYGLLEQAFKPKNSQSSKIREASTPTACGRRRRE